MANAVVERPGRRNGWRRLCPGGGRDGHLYAGGEILTAGGVPANGIAKWDPAISSWSGLGAGLDNTVYALAVDESGNLYAGGDFTAAGGAVAGNHIAKWDGTTSSWSALGGSGINGTVQALAVDGNGTAVFTGGNFSVAGGVTANFTARWDGMASSWSALGSEMNGTIQALAVDGKGHAVYAGGYSPLPGAAQANGIAKWDGRTSSWSALGSGLDGPVEALTADGRGKLYAGVRFDYGTPTVVHYYVAMREGTGWRTLGSSGDDQILGPGSRWAAATCTWGAVSPKSTACPANYIAQLGWHRRGSPLGNGNGLVPSGPWQ